MPKTSMIKEVENMKYNVIKKGETRKSFAEKTFCFYCGCFQGGSKPPMTKD